MFSSYRAINGINLEENVVKMMGPYKPTEPLARLIEKIEKKREFTRAGGQAISNNMMMSKGITLLAQTGIFNDNIHEWRRQTTDQKKWAKYKLFFNRSHQEQRRAITTAGKGCYTATVKTSIVNHLPL